MQIQNVQSTNYHPSFNAMLIYRKNPRISKEVRTLAEKANTFLEKCVETKTPNGVTINIGHRTAINGVKFSKIIDGKQAELEVSKSFGDTNTDLRLKLTEPGSDKYSMIWYSSTGFGTDLENIDAYYERISDHEVIGPIKGYRGHAKKCAALKKYAEILLQDI